MKLYNTLTRSVEPFQPLDPARVTLYVCGPTVYDIPHLGHARSAFIFEVLRRHLARTTDVQFVRNVTDIDDKIIAQARQELGRADAAACGTIAAKYLDHYHTSMGRLGLPALDAAHEPSATDHIDAMLDFVSKLLMDGIAYEADDGVYFSVRAFPAYGRLSNRSLDDLQAGARVEPGEHKRDPLDFALWKKAKPDEPSWNSPWGPGRPGWHIECSTMSTTLLGDAFDIHGGGLDLIFPHHENEIAQAQAAGKPFARVWVHNGLLTVNGEKMAKSVGNVITVERALQDCQGRADTLKLFFLSSHYRSPVDYTETNLRAAEGRYRRLLHFCHAAMNQPAKAATRQRPAAEVALTEGFHAAMDDDLNTPRALATLDQLATLGYERRADQRHLVAGEIVQLGHAAFGLFDHFLPVQLSPAQAKQLEAREAARRRRDYATADEIRNQLAAQGLGIEDTPEGPVALPKP